MVNSILHTSLSGLIAGRRRLEVSAADTANVNTRGYISKRVSGMEIPGGGVRLSNTGSRLKTMTSDIAGVSLVEESVERIVSAAAFNANADVLRTADDILGNAVNIKV